MRHSTLAPLLLALSFASGAPMTAHAQNAPAVVASDATLLNISAQAEARRVPDVATLSAGVVTQAADGNSAMRDNAAQMDKVMAAIKAVPYSGQVKIGLEMKRRFWEEDEDIYGGHSFTDQEISLISYPNNNMFREGPAVLLGGFARELAASMPAVRRSTLYTPM